VVDFHGLAEGATIHAQTSQFGVLGQKDGFVVVFPNGTGSPVQWNTSAQAKPNPDLNFVTAMLNQVESNQCIDTSRVYASGFSDGSFMVSLVACTMSSRFAAIAAVSGLQLPKPCPTTRRVPILAFHGTADPILFFNGGVGIDTLNHALGTGGPEGSSTTTTTQPAQLHGRGYPATVQAWAVKDRCNRRSTDTRVASQVILRTYRCPPGTAVRFYIILGGGHAWPGSTFSQSISSITGFTTFQINATNQIWAFFQRFRL
jgi:polyhydroxybutyrate depolymerase